ncbi:MAG: ferrous iron transport protein A [Akkermansia sp.]
MKDNNNTTLNKSKVGSTVTIANVMGQGALRQRILDMGLTRGTKVQILKLAPLGDPMEISIRGYELSLRKAEAEQIVVG